MPNGGTSPYSFINVDPLGNPVTTVNAPYNYGWEYIWHCHILGHEENDMMRPMCFAVPPEAPTNLQWARAGNAIQLTWVNNSLNATSNIIQRATNNASHLTSRNSPLQQTPALNR
jgi:hypothetical protein